MRNIGYKAASHSVKPAFLLNIVAQLGVCLGKLCKRSIKRFRKRVYRACKLTYFVLTVNFKLTVEIKLCHILGYFVHLGNRAGELPREYQHPYYRKQKANYRYENHKLIGD